MVAINSAESNRAQLKYIPEVTWGTTPSSGVVKEMRITSSGMVAGKETKTSDELRADRMVSNIIEVAAMSSGEVNFEFSAGSLDDFMQGFLLGTWSEDMTHLLVKGAAVSVTGTSVISIAGADYTDWISNVNHVKAEGFLNGANNGYFAVSSVAFSGGNTNITVAETGTLVVEAGTANTRVMDASDVIIKSTTTAFTSGNTVNGGGSNSFSGHTIVPGQKVWIESVLGKETGTIVAESANPGENDTITISDGIDTIVFEVATDAETIAAGNIHIPLSNTEATFAENIRAAVMGQFAKRNFQVSATISSATVTFMNHRRTGGSIAASDDATSVTVTNFSGGSATKGGLYTVATVPNDDTFTTVETLSTDANAGSNVVTIKGSHLRNPGTVSSITKRSFTIETGFTDVSKYFRMRGMRAGTFSLSVTSGEIVTGSVSFMGKDTTNASTEVLAGGSYTERATTNTEVMNATSNVGSVMKDGTTLTLALKSIELNGEANLREQRAVGEKFPAGIGYGRFNLSGSMEAYFEDFSFYDDFINHTTVSLSFSMADVDSFTYYFTIPALKITSDPIAPGGIDQDVMESMEWEAQRDPVLNTQFMVDRFSSLWPASNAL